MDKLEEFYSKKREPAVIQEKEKEIGSEKSNTKKIMNKKNLIRFLVSVFILAVMGVAGYYYFQYKKVLESPTDATKGEVSAILDNIKKFMDLPDEEPTLATVADKEKLKDQTFFSSAQNGDKVLIFPKSQKAILYRPSTKRVIEMTSLMNGNVTAALPEAQPENNSQNLAGQTAPAEETKPEESQSEAAPEIKKAVVSVYNGTNISGLAKTIAQEIADIEGVEIGEKSNAAGIFTENLVVDISGSNSKLAQTIAEKIDGKVSQLPEGESKPDADILIIGGKK